MSAPIYEPFFRFDRFFDSFHETPRLLCSPSQVPDACDGAVLPFKSSMDLHENPEANTVTATLELPGFKKEDVNIDLHNGKLTITAESKTSSEHEENEYTVRERHYGKYSRTLRLPQGVKHDEVKASMEEGILTVTFPRTPESTRKAITIA